MTQTLWSTTPDQVVRYTEGDCWLVAFELGCLLGAPLVSICDPLDQDDWHHVTVDLGCETLLDALGLHSRYELTLAWEKRTHSPVAIRELGRFHDLDAYLHALDGERQLAAFVSRRDEDDARQFAREITRALTETTHDHADDHIHSWSSRFWQEQMGA